MEVTVIPIDPWMLACLVVTGICAILVVLMDFWEKANRRPTDEVELMLWTCKRKPPLLPELTATWMIGWCDHAFRAHLPPVIQKGGDNYGYGKHAPPEDDIAHRAAYNQGYAASRDRNGYPCP